jgi:vitamin K-dependent gamma-carboxylase-like protein
VNAPFAGVRRALAAWDRFWFASQSVSTLAVIRIAYGLLLLGWAGAIGGDLLAFFSNEGILPTPPDPLGPGAWGLLGTFSGNGAVVVAYSALVVSALMLTLGLQTRVAAVVAFVTVLALMRRNPWVLDSGDLLIQGTAFYLALAPSGAALSADRWLATRNGKGEFWAFPRRAPWVLRLLQVQLSILYLSAFWQKTGGEKWRDGTAVSYALQLGDLQRLPVPDELTTSVLVTNVLTFGTLAVELALGILVWNRTLRPWVLLAGVALHLGIDYAIRVGFFSYAVLLLYLAFIPPERMDRWLTAVRNRLARLPFRKRVTATG